MPETCYIKDEHGKFQGRNPGCKMDNGAGGTAAVKDSTGGNAKSDNTTTDAGIGEILKKPPEKWTAEERQRVREFLDKQVEDIAKAKVDALLTVLSSGARLAAIIANSASSVATEELMKYAEEKLPGHGAMGVAIAAAALGMVRGKSPAGEIAKAKKVAAAVKAEKAAAAYAKSRKDLGNMYDKIEKKGYTMPNKDKYTTGVNTGNVSPAEAQKLNTVAKQANKFDGYTTETTVAGMEHAIARHGTIENKIKIKKGMQDAKKEIHPSQEIDETARGQIPLTREDFQNVQKYRQDALGQKDGVKIRPKVGDQHETIVYKAEVKEKVMEKGVEKEVTRVITMMYEVDPVNKRLIFITMFKK